jgi:hypothetical protein
MHGRHVRGGEDAGAGGGSASSTPSTVEMAQPPLRLLEKVPSFSLRSLNNGLLASRNCSARVMAMSVSCPFVLFRDGGM